VSSGAHVGDAFEELDEDVEDCDELLDSESVALPEDGLELEVEGLTVKVEPPTVVGVPWGSRVYAKPPTDDTMVMNPDVDEAEPGSYWVTARD
jgi:hypothetical protein